MATRRSRCKTKLSTNSETLAENIVRANIGTRSKKRGHEESDCESDESDQTSFSLEVLAQVASATLQKEPCRKNSPKKITQRSVRSKEMLSLGHIRALTDKALITMFSIATFNELSRNYTYTCFLMPTVCKEKYTSFGNETKAKTQMKTHLHNHISKLLDDASDPNPAVPFHFLAEPVNVWKKRVAEIKKQAKRFKRKNALKDKKKTEYVKNQNFTKLKIREKENKLMSDFDFEFPISEDEERSPEPVTQNWNDSNKVPVGAVNKKSAQEHKTRTKKDIALALKEKIIGKKRSENKSPDKVKEEEETEFNEVVTNTEKNTEEQEAAVMESLNNSQSYDDHSYTSTIGKKYRKCTEHSEFNEDGGDRNNIIYVSSQGSHLIDDGCNRISDEKKEPILDLQAECDMDTSEIPVPCGEEIVGNVTMFLVEAGCDLSLERAHGARSNEGVTTYVLEAKNENLWLYEKFFYECRLLRASDSDIQESDVLDDKPDDSVCDMLSPASENLSAEEEEEDAEQQESDVEELMPEKKINVRLSGNKPRAEWEKKLALKYIKDLKNKKRVIKNGCLSCKICKDKTFTASATLMYHYRSHAGIKPFVCLICNTTFTRQHSLNYHMLIHNNQSRFTCKDCGRKFRHPSHFKEHMRRHTGETPFVCGDCPQKFKTRNTYKRHLKTRHGKLLTASGIEILSNEEFLEICSQRGRKSGKNSDDINTGEQNSRTEIAQLSNNQPFPVVSSSVQQESINIHVEGGQISRTVFLPFGVVVT